MAKKVSTRKSSPRVETDQYFEGMEPPSIPALDKAVKAAADAKAELEQAKSNFEAKENALQNLMQKNEDKLERAADGKPRYCAKSAPKAKATDTEK